MTPRILIVDDDRQMVRTLSDIVSLHGWTVDGAYSGEAAVDAVGQREYDAVLMDVRMTGINGVEAFKAMKSVRPGIKVILMTAYSAAKIIAEAEREGALQVLAKPVVLPNLFDMLDQMTQGTKPVMLVADDAELLSVLHTALEESSYAWLEATSLSEALTALEEQTPLVVVLDQNVSGVNPGDSVLAIKRVSPGVALILCDGDSNGGGQTPTDPPPALIYATLHKPFSPEKLIDTLEGIIEP
jgi:DNA-binding NtrC family response regulator